jgi:hypothetical protein
MPWRLAPRAAYSVGLVGLIGLTGSLPFVRLSDDAAPPDPSSLQLRTLGCARVGSDAWSPLILGDAIPLDIEAWTPSGTFPITQEHMASGPGVGVPPDLWLEGGSPWDLPGELVRVTLPARAERAETIALSLGRRAPRVLARLSGYDAALQTRVCAATRFTERWPAADAYEIDVADSRHFVTGWYAEDVGGDGAPLRWMRQHGAVLVPSPRDGVVTVKIRASPPDARSDDEPPLVSLRINDIHDATPQVLSPGWRDYEWTVPATAWVPGINELLFVMSKTAGTDSRGRTRGLALQRLTVSIADRATGR